jgi:uncharacterized protein YdiU (UPF0061 family)
MSGAIDQLRELINFLIQNDFSGVIEPGEQDQYLKFFYTVVIRTAILTAKWMSNGFIHGYITIDYVCHLHSAMILLQDHLIQTTLT